MNGFGKNIVLWLSVAVVLLFLFNILQNSSSTGAKGGKGLSYSQFMADAQSGEIANVMIKGQELFGVYSSSGERFKVMVPPNENVVERLKDTAVEISADKEDPEEMSFASIIVSLLPAILIIGVWLFFMRQITHKGY